VKDLVLKCDSIIDINDYDGLNDQTKVLLNGAIIGMTEEPDDLVVEFDQYRQVGLLPHHVSISHDNIEKEININSDEGRLIRPVFPLKDGKLIITEADGTNWDELVNKGLIKYVDNSEINTSVVAFTPDELVRHKYDLCEIHPSMMMGVMASIIPFPDHSQAPRNCYQCLDPDTLIVMGDNSMKAIKDIIVGDKVITVDPITQDQSITSVINQYVKQTDKNIITIFE